ncbi:MAG: hypothetical protein HY719_04320, partial [Planctomycetes bacterium]|nr:hypothetical protein [Planctomycetota bacterium]
MKRLAIDDIPRDGPLRRPVYHEGGLLLFDKGEEVTARLVDLLRVAGVSHVFHFDKLLDNPDKFLERQSRREVPTASVTLGDVSAAPLFDREGRLLVNAGQEITAKVLANLLKARVEKTWVNKTDDERGLPQLDRFRELRRLYADPATD